MSLPAKQCSNLIVHRAHIWQAADGGAWWCRGGFPVDTAARMSCRAETPHHPHAQPFGLPDCPGVPGGTADNPLPRESDSLTRRDRIRIEALRLAPEARSLFPHKDCFAIAVLFEEWITRD